MAWVNGSKDSDSSAVSVLKNASPALPWPQNLKKMIIFNYEMKVYDKIIRRAIFFFIF